MNELDLRIQEESERVVDMLMSEDADLHKEAAQSLDEYTRIQNREGSFLPKIMEPSPFDRNRLQQELHTDQPVMYFEYEQTSPFAIPVDYGTTPVDFIPRGRRYVLRFARINTRRVKIDLLELQTYRQDVRQILGDNMTKDLIALRDHKFLSRCRQALGGQNVTLPWVGKPLHVDIGSPMSFTAFIRGINVMKDTPFHIRPGKVLMNDLRETDLMAMGVEELQGTDKSVDIMTNGYGEAKLANMQILMTIKKRMVNFNETFWFGPQEFLGRYIQWMEPTMSLKREDTYISFYLYEVLGITIAHPGALAICRYQ